MTNEIFRYSFIIAVGASVIFLAGCEYKSPASDSNPVIKHVIVGSDLSEALGLDLVKYEFNLHDMEIPKGKLPFITTWVELYQDDKIVREWSTPHEVINKSGSILFASYEPPLFTNDQDSIKARVIIEGNGQSRMDISPEIPFKIFGHGLDFSEKNIEFDTEYTLAKVTERFSPYAKTRGIASPDPNSGGDLSENKALILKAKFGLIDE
ncbi:MAG: hypothetical protein P8016_15580 [Sedimentisphaerales bacterium]